MFSREPRIKCQFALVALSSVLALTISPAQAQTAATLSLDEALNIATGNSPALAAAASGIQAGRDMAVSAGQLPDPVLRLGIDNLPVNGQDSWSLVNDFMTQRRVGIMQEYVSPEKRGLLRRRSELDSERLIAARRTLAANIRRDVAIAWLERYYAIQARGLLRVLEAEVELQLRTLDAQLRAGKALASEMPMATAVLLQMQDRIQVADKQEQLARITLERWLGKDAKREPAGVPDVGALNLDPAKPELASMAPGVKEHASERELVQAELAIAESTKTPNWSWEVSYSQRGSAYSNMVSIGVSIPLVVNSVNKQDREIAAKQAQVLQAHALHDDMVRDTRANIATVYAEWQSLIERRKRLAQALLPAVRQRIELTMAAYRSGQGTLATVLEARRSEVEAQLQLLDLERDAARLWAQLEYVYAESAKGAVDGANK